MFSVLLLTFCIAPPIFDFEHAKQLTLRGDYQASESILANIKPEDQSAYFFYRLVNNFSLNKMKEAIRWADMVEHSFGDVPQRYRDLAAIMKADAVEWKQEDNDLEDISREMKKAADRLKNNKAGKMTRIIQDQASARLAKMIKDMEKKRDDALAQAKDKDSRPIPGKDEDITPPPDTPNSGEIGTGKVDNKKIREIAEVWGKLPEKERAAALVGLIRNLPPKDQQLIKKYFIELQKGRKK